VSDTGQNAPSRQCEAQIDDNGIVICVPGRVWEVEFHPAFEAWASDLDQEDSEALLAAIRVLRNVGPTLGRPLVDSVKGSRHQNMKELRPGSTGRTEIRVLFAFDTDRKAILLVGGDKSKDWKRWYGRNIPLADKRLEEHQNEIPSRSPKKAISRDAGHRDKDKKGH
jgi:hypothetical protein